MTPREIYLRLAADAERTARTGYRCTMVITLMSFLELWFVLSLHDDWMLVLLPSAMGALTCIGSRILDAHAQRWRDLADG